MEIVKAIIYEQSYGFPRIGDYAVGYDKNAYQVISLEGTIHRGTSRRPNYIYGEVKRIDWVDVKNKNILFDVDIVKDKVSRELIYTFVVEGTVSFSTKVEASSLEEAIDEAKSRPTMSVPASVGDPDTKWMTEIDCDACAGTLVDVYFDPESDMELSEVRDVWEKR